MVNFAISSMTFDIFNFYCKIMVVAKLLQNSLVACDRGNNMKKMHVALLLLAFGCSEGEDQELNVSNSEVVDLSIVAQRIVDNSMTEAKFLELDLNHEQFMNVVFEVGYIHGFTSDELEKEFYGDSPILMARGSCTQTVEKMDLSGDTYSSTHYQNTWCDGDGSDVDWLYDFYPGWGDYPDNFRWWAGNWWVRTVFGGAYSGELIGYSLCSSPVQLCVGTTGVSVAGGHNVVANSLFISH